jgi:hypothetical protein
MTLEPTGPTSSPLFATPISPASDPSSPEANATLPVSQPASAPLDGSPSPAGESSLSAPTTAAGAAAAAGGATLAQWEALPKAWKREMEAEWAGLPPSVKQYAHEREQQVLRGIQQYSQGHDKWTRLTQPFADRLGAEDPVTGFQQLAHNHFLLTQAPMEQRVALARDLLQHYGISPELLGGAPAGQQAASGQPGGAFSPEQLAYLQQALTPLASQLQQTTSHLQAQRVAEQESVVDAFFSNPQNQFAEAVGPDMLAILQQGKASSLAEAYELAVLRNPEIKAKYIASLAGAKPPAVGNLTNVKSSPTPVLPHQPATIDESIAAVVKKHYG